jgi:type III secretion system YscJ/HrcJ family lipoprotein
MPIIAPIRRSRLFFASVSMLMLIACAKTEVVHELEEKEANEIVVLLDSAEPPIAAQKLPDVAAQGNKGPRFMIVVPGAEANRAWKILTQNNLPRRKDQGLTEVFSQGGLVPTQSEEKAKWLNAIQGDLARTLKSIDGILDARVHIVMPEDSVLRVKEEDRAIATASVWYKYAPRDKKAPKPLTDQEVAELVANSVEKLKPENVKVIATTALPSILGAATMDDTPMANPSCGGLEKIMGLTLCKNDINKFRGITIGVVAFIVIITIVFMVALLKKSRVTPPKTLARAMPPGEPPPS